MSVDADADADVDDDDVGGGVTSLRVEMEEHPERSKTQNNTKPASFKGTPKRPRGRYVWAPIMPRPASNWPIQPPI